MAAVLAPAGGGALGAGVSAGGARIAAVFAMQCKHGVGKPVIYLYPEVPLDDVSVTLRVKGMRLSTLLPTPASSSQTHAHWRVAASPDGTLQPLGDHCPPQPPVASLFWEAERPVFARGELLPAGASDTFCVPGEGAGQWLLGALSRWGLTPREYTECELLGSALSIAPFAVTQPPHLPPS